MTDTAFVQMEEVRKKFVTRHFFHVDEETRKRRLYNRRETEAAKGISFEVERGEIFGLLGPNGAGKTTTVKMISGLVKPDGGRVLVGGRDVERHRRKILRDVGVVLEGTRTTIWPLTPLENLAYYGNLKNVKGSLLKQRSHDLLDFIGLKDKKNVQVRYLSRGQKQKLAICIALIADPQLLLLDEPTTGLDVQSSRSIKDKLIEITRAQQKSVVVTTHDMHVAQELCDRIGIISNGELVECKPTDQLLDIFSDQVYIFKLDRLPEAEDFNAIEGLINVEMDETADEPSVVLSFPFETGPRSQAMYETVARLRERGFELRGIQHRQQNLESVFLKITGEAPTPAEVE